MSKVSCSRSLDVEAARVWELLADPHNLPRWWPETVRVESVEGGAGGRRGRFTQVFETDRGTPVRADYRVTGSTQPQRLVWEQQIEGTPFEKFLRRALLEMRISDEGTATTVTLEGRRDLRGLSRLGAPIMSRATRRTLNQALDGIERALVVSPAGDGG